MTAVAADGEPGPLGELPADRTRNLDWARREVEFIADAWKRAMRLPADERAELLETAAIRLREISEIMGPDAALSLCRAGGIGEATRHALLRAAQEG